MKLHFHKQYFTGYIKDQNKLSTILFFCSQDKKKVIYNFQSNNILLNRNSSVNPSNINIYLFDAVPITEKNIDYARKQHLKLTCLKL